MILNVTGLLKTPALQAVSDQFDAMMSITVDRNLIDYDIDPVTSEFILRGREFALDGSPGTIVGELRRPYGKVALDTLLPTPLLIELNYPCTYDQLKQHLQQRYQILLEENDLAKASTPNTPLLGSHYVDDPVELTLGIVDLVVTSQSGRFQTGGRLRLRVASPGGKRKIQDAYHQTKDIQLQDLKFASVSVSNRSLFTASAEECANDLIKRHLGLALDRELDVRVTSKNHSDLKVLIQTRLLQSNGWIGGSEFIVRKADIGALCPEALQVNLDYPTQFQLLQSYLYQAYGLSIEANEMAMGQYEGTVLGPTDTVDYPLSADGFLDLVVQANSTKWLGRSQLRLQFLRLPDRVDVPKIVSQAPEGNQGVQWEYTFAVVGGTAPYHFEYVIGDQPAVLDEALGHYNGMPLQGLYMWTVLVTDSLGRWSFHTDVAQIGPRLFSGPYYLSTTEGGGHYVSSYDDVKYIPIPGT